MAERSISILVLNKMQRSTPDADNCSFHLKKCKSPKKEFLDRHRISLSLLSFGQKKQDEWEGKDLHSDLKVKECCIILIFFLKYYVNLQRIQKIYCF